MKLIKRILLIITTIFLLSSCVQEKEKSLSFIFTADMRDYTGDNKDYFRGACEAIKNLENIQFIVSPGDLDPPDSTFYTMQKYIDKDIVWYPVVGNHEAETDSDMEWLRNHNKEGNSLPNVVNVGPSSCLETTYSFDYENTHFIVLNEYCNENCDNCTNGDIPDVLYNWLENDLKKNTKKHIFVLGHEPAYPLPDMETQRYRHVHDCLNQNSENRDRFINLLQDHEVLGYVVGHTHNYSIVKINELWHIDVGHGRGRGDMGARSTFIKVSINNDKVNYQTYRLDYESSEYKISDTGSLN